METFCVDVALLALEAVLASSGMVGSLGCAARLSQEAQRDSLRLRCQGEADRKLVEPDRALYW